MSKPPSDVVVLNDVPETESGPTAVVLGEDVANELRTCLTALMAAHVHADGDGVKYRDLALSSEFDDFIRIARKLQAINFEVDLQTFVERRAFFINLYNCLTIHALASQDELPKSPLDVQDLYRRYAYNVGGFICSLDDIEHGILRGNRGHPRKGGEHFEPDDPRLIMSVALDPRIHFALNCGAVSCPPIRVYSSEKLNEQLDMAAVAYNSSVDVDGVRHVVELPKLYLWYENDFAEDKFALLTYVANILSESNPELSQNVIFANSGDFEIVYQEYQWGLNIRQ